VFTELDNVFGPRRRATKQLRKYPGEGTGHQTVTPAAKEGAVSGSLVKRSFTEETASQLGVNEEKPQASWVIGLDGFSVKKRMFDIIISDLEQRMVLGIVEGCGKSNMEKCFDLFLPLR